jgi:hypothetical protein
VSEDMMRTVDTGKSPTCFFEFTDQVSATHVCMIHTTTLSVNRSTSPGCGQLLAATAASKARPLTHRGAASRFDRNLVWPQCVMISTAPKRPVACVGTTPYFQFATDSAAKPVFQAAR